MKHVLFVLALTVAAGILGCQENAVDPFTESGAPNLEKAVPAPIVYPVVIRINASLPDPRQGPGREGFLMLKGSVSCSVADDGRIDPPFPVMKVDLATNILITPFGIGSSAPWNISAISSDYVALPLNDAGLLQKNYTSSGSGTAGLVLHMTFKVTTKTLTLSEMWLTITPIVRVDY